MAGRTSRDRLLPKTLAGILLGLVQSRDLPADPISWSEAEGLLQLLPETMDPNRWSWMERSRLSFHGWLDAGITHNFENSSDRFNGPVTFSDRSGELQANQIYFYLERSLDVLGGTWDFGGRVDFLFGTDAAFTQAFGDPKGNWDQRLTNNRFYEIALPQAYVEILFPIAQGIRAKLGHFYSILGSESVMAPENFFYSHSYTMQFGEPFTHTGALFSYAPSGTLNISAGAVTGSRFAGWDGVFDRSLDNWAFLGGVTWANTKGDTSLALNGTHGTVTIAPEGELNSYSLVIQHDWTDSLHQRIQQDYGRIDGNQASSVDWLGLLQYLMYDLNPSLALGIRAEWFRDNGGVRVLSPAREASTFLDPGSYYAITAGLNWRPAAWLMLRPNLRYDWSEGTDAFSAGSRNSQLLFSADILLNF
ncbi:MAG TPA: porin [Methylococcus sp.]|nr:porin [Methylococcus sp.]